MSDIDLRQLCGSRMLGTRPAARLAAPTMRLAAAEDGVITLDTARILRVGVSFFDEVLLVLREIIAESGNHDLRLVYRQAPAMPSLKKLAYHRGFVISETPAGDWVIALSQDAGNSGNTAGDNQV